MTARRIKQIISAHAVPEGAGVTVHRSLGTPALRNLDPFLMLDHFATDKPEEYIAGFPDHPHRGFVTLTYMIDGHMLHQDSMGNRGDLRSGGIQWMKAASGVIHSEMPQQTNGVMRGFQLWINLPAKEKMTDPAYQDHPDADMPKVGHDGVRVKIISGEYAERRGPIDDPNTHLTYFDIALDAGKSFQHSLPASMSVFAYIYDGSVVIDGTNVATHHLVVLGDGDAIEIAAGAKGAKLILVAGEPIGEPVVQYGPFVMNTPEEIHQAFDDYKAGRLVRANAK